MRSHPNSNLPACPQGFRVRSHFLSQVELSVCGSTSLVSLKKTQPQKFGFKKSHHWFLPTCCQLHGRVKPSYWIFLIPNVTLAVWLNVQFAESLQVIKWQKEAAFDNLWLCSVKRSVFLWRTLPGKLFILFFYHCPHYCSLFLSPNISCSGLLSLLISVICLSPCVCWAEGQWWAGYVCFYLACWQNTLFPVYSWAESG